MSQIQFTANGLAVTTVMYGTILIVPVYLQMISQMNFIVRIVCKYNNG